MGFQLWHSGVRSSNLGFWSARNKVGWRVGTIPVSVVLVHGGPIRCGRENGEERERERKGKRERKSLRKEREFG